MAGYRNKYDVYDIEKGEIILKNANSGEIEKVTGLPSIRTATYAKKEYTYNKRYRVIAKTKPTQEVKFARTPEVVKLMKEWDRVRKNPELWRTIKTELLGDYKYKFVGQGRKQR